MIVELQDGINSRLKEILATVPHTKHIEIARIILPNPRFILRDILLPVLFA
jgi:hypothetical protein